MTADFGDMMGTVFKSLPVPHRFMKVALFTDSYLPVRDGVVSSILSFRSGLRQKKHDMYVFAPSLPHAKAEAGVFRYPSVKFFPYPDYRAAILPGVHPSAARKVHPQLVHSKAMVNMGLAAISYARMKKIPAMASLETMIPDGVHYVLPHSSMHGFGKEIAWSYLRWFYSNFSLVTAPSAHAQGIMQENGIEAQVLPSPVDTQKFRPNRHGKIVKKQLGLAGKKVVLSVGRVVKEKNYSFLVRTAKRMRGGGVVFLIAGKGPYLDELKKEAQSSGVASSFHFAGFVPDALLVDYYNAADCFVFPSSFETQGLSALEAFACGKPAAVLDNTPMSELVVEGKNGYVFGNDEKECAEKIMACLEKSRRMSPAARSTALKYSIPKCTDALLKCYKKLLEK